VRLTNLFNFKYVSVFVVLTIWVIRCRKNKTSREVFVNSRTESDNSVSKKEKEPEVKPTVEDACTDHPEGARKSLVPPLDKNETVVSNEIYFFDKLCMISCVLCTINVSVFIL
jgi:hypothetical protein